MVLSLDISLDSLDLSQLLVHFLQVLRCLHAALLHLAQLILQFLALVLLRFNLRLFPPNLLLKLTNGIDLLVECRSFMVTVGPSTIRQVFLLFQSQIQLYHLLFQLLNRHLKLLTLPLCVLLLLGHNFNL